MENIKPKQEYIPMPKEALHAIKEGDVIERMLAFCIPMYLTVIGVTEDIINCGWTFDRHTGLEVDDDIPVKVSYIKSVLTDEQKKEVIETGKLSPNL